MPTSGLLRVRAAGHPGCARLHCVLPLCLLPALGWEVYKRIDTPEFHNIHCEHWLGLLLLSAGCALAAAAAACALA